MKQDRRKFLTKLGGIIGGAAAATQVEHLGLTTTAQAQRTGGGSLVTRRLGSLRFDATKRHHVNLGQLYKSDVIYSNFFHEALIATEYSANGAYWFSDGHGAAHGGGLHGLADTGGGQYRLTGNIWDGIQPNPNHTSGDYLYYGANQVYHVVYGYDGTKLYTFIDGICAGIKPYTAARTSNSNSTGVSYIGGSDHNNYSGWIFWVRFYETVLPLTNLNYCFRPEKSPRSNVGAGDCSLLISFDTPSYVFRDQSDGFDNTNTSALRSYHNGILSREGQTPLPAQPGGLGNIFSGDNAGYQGASLKDFTENGLPQFDNSLTVAPRPYLGSAPVVPAGYLAYDSFSRADQTWLHHAVPDLGQTEGGSLGQIAWGSGDGYFHTWGILSGAALCYYPNQNCEVISHPGLGVNREVFIDRLTNENGFPRAGHEGQTGLCYGYIDQGTRGILKCFYSSVSNAMVFNLIESVGGEFNTIITQEAVCPAQFTTISVRVEGTRRRVYTNASATALIDVNIGDAAIGAATKMGLHGLGNSGCMRFKNFGVKAV